MLIPAGPYILSKKPSEIKLFFSIKSFNNFSLRLLGPSNHI